MVKPAKQLNSQTKPLSILAIIHRSV